MSAAPSLPDTPTVGELRAAALAYAARGWHVIRCRVGGKEPIDKGWPERATTDPTVIREWWRCTPYNIGIACGPSGLWVLDVDAGDMELPPLPPTLEAETGRDGGRHLYFAARGLPNMPSKKGGPKIDAKSEGGQVIVPPSLHPSGRRYRWALEADVAPLPDWLPGWLAEAQTPPTSTPKPPIAAASSLTTPPPAADSPYVRAAVASELDKVRSAGEGTRNTQLNNSACALGNMVGAGWIGEAEAQEALMAAAVDVGLERGESLKTIRSGLKRGKLEPRHAPDDGERMGAATAHLEALRAELAAQPMKDQVAPGCEPQQKAGGTEGLKRQKPKQRKPVSRKLSEVELRHIEWDWPGRIARGKHTTIAGEPGVGKSTMLYCIAAQYTKGGAWPCGEGTAPTGSVILLSAEDGAEDTIAPRVLAAGGDLDKVHVITAIRDGDGKISGFTLSEDLAALENLVAEIGDVRLIIVDPISSYLGGADGHSNTDIRGVVEPLHEMADRLRVAVLTNTHFAKSGAKDKSRASHRVIGSTAFIALPRAAFSVVQDPDDANRRLVLHLKNNIAKPAPGLAFSLGQALATYIDGDPLYASRVLWEAGHVEMTADDAIASHEAKLREGTKAEDRASPARTEAEEFLRELLGNGAQTKKDVEQQAKAAGISLRTLRKAREHICDAERQKDDSGKIVGSIWRLKPCALVPLSPYDSAHEGHMEETPINRALLPCALQEPPP